MIQEFYVNKHKNFYVDKSFMYKNTKHNKKHEEI